MAEDQRLRIIIALGEAVSRCGYDATAVEQIIQPAGVSRRTFYDLFSGKAAAFYAAHEEALALAAGCVERACQAEPEWPRKVAAAIAAALEWAAAEPSRARLVAGGPLTAGPHTAYCHDRLVGCFAPGLARGRGTSGFEASPAVEEALLAGLAGIVAARLIEHRAGSLPTLAPQLIELMLSPYLGIAEAQRIARMDANDPVDPLAPKGSA